MCTAAEPEREVGKTIEFPTMSNILRASCIFESFLMISGKCTIRSGILPVQVEVIALKAKSRIRVVLLLVILIKSRRSFSSWCTIACRSGDFAD